MVNLIASYKQEAACYLDEYGDVQYDDYSDQENWEHINKEVDKVLDSRQYVLVNGVSNSWNGSRSFSQVIAETDLDSIIKTYLNNLDNVEIYVYSNGVVKFINHHHDGTNTYEFRPIYLDDLKKKQLLNIIDDSVDLFKQYYGRGAKYAPKQELINFIDYEGLI